MDLDKTCNYFCHCNYNLNLHLKYILSSPFIEDSVFPPSRELKRDPLKLYAILYFTLNWVFSLIGLLKVTQISKDTSWLSSATPQLENAISESENSDDSLFVHLVQCRYDKLQSYLKHDNSKFQSLYD